MHDHCRRRSQCANGDVDDQRNTQPARGARRSGDQAVGTRAAALRPLPFLSPRSHMGRLTQAKRSSPTVDRAQQRPIRALGSIDHRA